MSRDSPTYRRTRDSQTAPYSRFRRLHLSGDRGLAESCVRFLKERDSESPFFLVASFINPHNICEYARHQNTPDADIAGQTDLSLCPNLPANFAVNPYDADISTLTPARSRSTTRVRWPSTRAHIRAHRAATTALTTKTSSRGR